jgi:hypothetical protein
MKIVLILLRDEEKYVSILKASWEEIGTWWEQDGRCRVTRA